MLCYPQTLCNYLNRQFTFLNVILLKMNASVLRHVRKSVKSDCYLRYVCPSVVLEWLGSSWKDFHTIQCLNIFRKSVEKKISFVKICDKKNGYFTWRHVYSLLQDLAEAFLDWEVFQIKVVEKIHTHVLCSVTSYRISCSLWDNMEKWGRPGQVTDDSIRGGTQNSRNC